MEDLTTIAQNLPEMLARDLAEQQDAFLAKNITAGPPAVSFASARPPSVPKRQTNRVASQRSHCPPPEIILCLPKPEDIESALRFARETGLKDSASLKDAASSFAFFRAQQHALLSSPRNISIKQDNEMGERRIFLDGFDDEWTSDSSADADAAVSSRSVRTRRHSITTAATSIYAHTVVDGRAGTGRCGSIASSPEKSSARFALSEVDSLVGISDGTDATYESAKSGPWKSVATGDSRHEGRFQSTVSEADHIQDEDDGLGQEHVSIPQRRSSLIHQVGVAAESTRSRNISRCSQSNELVSPTTSTAPHGHSRCSSTQESLQSESESTRPATSPTVPLARHQNFFNPRIGLPQLLSDQSTRPSVEESLWHEVPTQTSTVEIIEDSQVYDTLYLDSPRSPNDQLSLPSLSIKEAIHFNASNSQRLQPVAQKQARQPRKSQSSSRIPRLSTVAHWIENQSRPPTMPTPSMTMSPIGNAGIRMRVSTEILENVRVSVVNFPDTMLLTSSYTVETIRSYVRKFKRGGDADGRDSLEHVSLKAEAPISPSNRTLNRKTSVGNMRLMGSLRGKLTARFGNLATSSSGQQNGNNVWPPADQIPTMTRHTALRPTTSHTQVETREVALRKIFPQGTDYLLDALYAHIIVYDYLDSICDNFSLHQSEMASTRSQPHKSIALPPGVTSLADLQCQPDASETVIKDFKADVKNIKSKNMVPSKAAAMLGIGSTNMGKPIKPSRGNLQGRESTPRRVHASSSYPRSLESDVAVRDLLADVVKNIYRIVETIESYGSSGRQVSEEDECEMIGDVDGKELPVVQMRLLREVVRLNEELQG